MDDKTDKKRAEIEKKQKLARLQELSDLRSVLDTACGQRVLLRILTKAGIMNQTFVPGEPDRTSFNQGRRAFGLMLLKDFTEADRNKFTMPAMMIFRD